MRFAVLAASFLLLTLAGSQPLRAEIQLSEGERAWREANPSISVAVDDDFAPINFIENGRPVGIAVDLLELVAQRAGLDIRLVSGSWSGLIEKAMNHEVDAIINADVTEARQEQLLYTRPYYRVPQAFVVREGADPVTSPDDLIDQRVAVVAGTSRIGYLQRQHPGVRVIEAETMLAQFALVVAGDADAMMSALPVVHHNMHENLIAGLRISGVFQTNEIDSLHIAVRNTAPELRSILDKAIADISREERLEILRRWLPPQLLDLPGSGTPIVEFSERERQWIAAHPVIRVAGDRAWPPIEYIGEAGQFEGLAVDYLRRIEESVGLRFEFDLESDWATAVERLRARELDMFSAAAETPERREYATFTAPYITLQAVVFTKDDESFVNGLTGLAGRRVAAVKGYAVTEFLRGVADEFELVEVPDVASGLRSLASGEIDAYVGSLLVTGHHLRSEGISNVMAAGEIPFRISIAMAARNDWPELTSILNKAIEAIGQQEREAMTRRWMGLQVSRPPDYAAMWRWAMVSVVVLLLFLSWNWYLQRKTSAQKAELRRQNAVLETEVRVRRRAEEEAQAANEMKSRLLANISHELRTPLNAIIGFSDMLSGDSARPVDDKRRTEYAGHINSAGRHLLTLVNDALDLSAVEAGTIVLDEQEVLLGNLLDEVMPMVRQRGSLAGVTVVLEPADALCRVMADPRRLRQVVLNLLENAIKFTPSGGRVDVGYDLAPDDSVRLFVQDTGVGMSEAQLNTAFRAFERGTDPFVRASEGVGLGLALCEEIMRLHGGRIELKSKPGMGTSATIVLPPERTICPGTRRPDSGRAAARDLAVEPL